MNIRIQNSKPELLPQQFMVDVGNGQGGETDVKEVSEMAEAMKQLNEDKIEFETKMSSIDTKTRLDSSEISYISSIDALVHLRVFPLKCLGITRQHKRLKISKDGLGRTESVSMATGLKQDGIAKAGGFNMNPKSWFQKDGEK